MKSDKEKDMQATIDGIKRGMKEDPMELRVAKIAEVLDSLMKTLDLTPLEQMAILGVLNGNLHMQLAISAMQQEYTLKRRQK